MFHKQNIVDQTMYANIDFTTEKTYVPIANSKYDVVNIKSSKRVYMHAYLEMQNS